MKKIQVSRKSQEKQNSEKKEVQQKNIDEIQQFVKMCFSSREKINIFRY